MIIDSYLLRKSVENISCSPRQDSQYILTLNRVTPKIGVLDNFQLYNMSFKLPEKRVRYHVFTAGRLTDKMAKLLKSSITWEHQTWYNLENVINQTSLFANIYNYKGLEFPKFECMYLFTRQNSVVFAIKENKSIAFNYNLEAVYLRLYTNSYFSSIRDASVVKTFCKGMAVTSTADIVSIQNLYNTYAGMPGHVFCYVNGVYTNSITLPKVSIGDLVEFIYDASVKLVDTFTVADLDSFTSIRDNVNKYLLMRKDPDSLDIDYYDDVDVHLVAPSGPTGFFGTYIYRNDPTSIRMVTHRDYSINASIVGSTGNNLNLLLNQNLDIQDYRIEIKVRHSGLSRTLPFEKNRIRELYKLDRTQRISAMSGVNALDIWMPEVLENSWFSRLMTSYLNDYTIENIESALGYNSISSLIAGTPQKTVLDVGVKKVDLPHGLTTNSTIYEYGLDGLLKARYYQPSGSTFISPDINTDMVEVLYGEGTDRPDVYFGSDNVPVTPIYNHRVYKCTLVGGIPDNNWIDVTGSLDYVVTNDVLVKTNVGSSEFFMVRTDMKFLVMDLDIGFVNGELFFTLAEYEDRGTGLDYYTMPVPAGELTVFLNGHSLVENIDYVLEFPMVKIINHKYLAQPSETATQHVEIRFTGFCKADLTLNEVKDTGWVTHGLLSNNTKFDSRDGKVTHVSVGGAVKAKDDVLFDEYEATSYNNSPLNGLPYQIKDLIVPLKTTTVTDVYELRDLDREVDKKVSDFMTAHYPNVVRTGADVIIEKHSLISPLLSRLSYDLVNNIITESDLLGLTTPGLVSDFLNSNYLEQLNIDPLTSGIVDTNFIKVTPHPFTNPVSLNTLQYNFIDVVITLKDISGVIDLTNKYTVV